MSESKTYEQKPRPMKPMRGRGMPVPKGAIKKGTFSRLMKTLFKYYKWRIILVFACIIVSAVGSLYSSIYMQQLVDKVIKPASKLGISAVQSKLIALIVTMVVVYSLVILANFCHTRIMATVTQGMLYHLREDMFSKMQTLPIKFLIRTPMAKL